MPGGVQSGHGDQGRDQRQSGVPISEFIAHPIYLNAGEVPLGGRGKLGRTAFFARGDLHFDYTWNLSERARASFIADFFNVTNNQQLKRVIQNRESTARQLNPDFGKPLEYHPPFNLRLGVKLAF